MRVHEGQNNLLCRFTESIDVCINTGGSALTNTYKYVRHLVKKQDCFNLLSINVSSFVA